MENKIRRRCGLYVLLILQQSGDLIVRGNRDNAFQKCNNITIYFVYFFVMYLTQLTPKVPIKSVSLG